MARRVIEGVVIREWGPDDSIEDLTELLHRAYRPLGEAGLNFTAVDQSVEVTRSRIAHGTCFVAINDGRIVGTVTVEPPYADSPCEYYRTPAVAAAHQLAVEPEIQGSGLGALLLKRAEDWARDKGYRELAIDTAAPAAHLIDYYKRRGFQPVGRVQWRGKTYESVVLSKALNEVDDH
jgi:GNAT superfamily N-acetyltransferase